MPNLSTYCIQRHPLQLSNSHTELKTLLPILIQNIWKLGIQMQVDCHNTKFKTEAMFFPSSLKRVKELNTEGSLPPNLTLPNNKNVQFTHKFKYLRATITSELNKDTEIKF
jgi:hypothetical protein